MINPDDLSLFIVVVGVRGSGKTLLLTELQEYSLRQAALIRLIRECKKKPKLFPKRKTRVFSNYPLKYFLKPDKLDVDRLVAWKKEYHDCWIYFDEIGEQFDNQDWQNQGAKMINKGVVVMRHRNISFASSLQSFDTLNNRLKWQTDVIIKCRDLCFTPWGRANNLKPGEVISTLWLDKSGVMTGYSYEESHRYYQMKFMGKRVWKDYDTTFEHDLMEMSSKYQIERNVKKMDLHGNVINVNSDQMAKQNARIQDIVDNTIEFFQHSQPGERIPTNDFWRKAKEMGLPDDDNQTRSVWGRYMSDRGVETRSYSGRPRYDFDKYEGIGVFK